MASNIADRHEWTVEILDPDPGDRLLEIGCGYGIAVSLICERLETGTITAIDRSEVMIENARERNVQCVDLGKATFLASTLDEGDFGEVQFDKAFAVNVSDFWNHPTDTLCVVREHLSPSGELYLFYQPPVEHKTHEITDSLIELLPEYGFTTTTRLTADIEPVLAGCIVARPA